MKEIMIILPSLGGGGAEKNVVMIANYLSKTTNVHIVCCYFNDNNKNIDSLDRNIKVTFLNSHKVLTSLPKIYRLIKKSKPNTVITTVAYFSLIFSIIIPVLPKNIKFICRETNIPDIYGLQKSFLYRFISKLIYKYFYTFYDVIICQSDDMLSSMEKYAGIDSNKLVKINNPALVYGDYNKADTLDLPSHENGYLISAGRLTYQKGFDLLIEEYLNSAFHKRKLPLFIAGVGPDEEKLHNLISMHDLNEDVYLIGFRNDISSLIFNATAFLLSSRYEGFPNVILESLALGCPVLARDCPGGLRELIIDSMNGILYKNDFDDASERLCSIEFDRDLIRADVELRFNKDKVLLNYLRVI